MDIAIFMIIGVIAVVGIISFVVISSKKDYEDEYEKKHLKTAQLNFSSRENHYFDVIKNNYFELVNELKANKQFKTWDQVQNTKYVRGLETASGIYIIYLEVENVSETIPLYVGQSKNIFSRWKQHQNQFRKIIKGEINTRTYKKIMHYLNIYGYSLQDLKFAVIDKCAIEQLKIQEKKYIDFFKSDIFGFNQTKGNK